MEENELIGIHKEIDNLGRIVIPKEMRVLFGLWQDVELVVTANGVLIRNPKYRLMLIPDGESATEGCISTDEKGEGEN